MKIVILCAVASLLCLSASADDVCSVAASAPSTTLPCPTADGISEGDLTSCAVLRPASETSPALIVTALTNGFCGAVRVVELGASPRVLQSYAPSQLHGSRAELRLEDLDGDKLPEIIVSMERAHQSSAVWVLRWNGSVLTPISPMIGDSDEGRTAITDASFVDLDGDGKRELVDVKYQREPSADGDEELIPSWSIYHFSGAAYGVPGQLSPLLAIFNRQVGQPEPEQQEFASVAGTRASVRIVGGAFNGVKVVSAKVWLNGALIASPSMFSEKSQNLLIPVTLAAQNTISVQVDGAPRSQLLVCVLPEITGEQRATSRVGR